MVNFTLHFTSTLPQLKNKTGKLNILMDKEKKIFSKDKNGQQNPQIDRIRTDINSGQGLQ